MRVRSQRLLLARIFGPWLFAVATWAGPARGQVSEKRELSEPPAPFVFGSVQCPDPKTVQQAVLSLIPPERYLLLERGVRVELQDLGDSYRVSVWKNGAVVEKTYSDPARDCEGRTRFAAVFTVLTLMPPELGLEPISKPEPESEPAAKPASPGPIAVTPRPSATRTLQPEPLLHLELSALFAYAPAIIEAPSLRSFGGELRLALGRGALSGTLSAAYLQRSQFELSGIRGEVARLPMSVGVRLRSDFDSWTLSADLALALTAQSVRATNLLVQHTASSLDVGVRAGIQVARKLGPYVAPFFGAFAWLSPAPSEIYALPQGSLGNLPYIWLGGAVGVSFGL
jgi:hypothetical protein